MTYGYVYKITNSVNGRLYVGQTTNTLESRFCGHRRGAHDEKNTTPLARAIRKYGEDEFDIELLEECNDRESLNEAEIRWIEKLDTYRNGYNATTGGDGGYIRSDETRKKLSNSLKGKMAGKNNPFYGRKHDPDMIERTKKVLSEKLSGENNPFYGKKHTVETREKISSIKKGHKMHENTAKALRKANTGNSYTKGKKISVAHREKLSKLTIDDVRFIRANSDRYTTREMADMFGVSWFVINDVRKHKTWKGCK